MLHSRCSTDWRGTALGTHCGCAQRPGQWASASRSPVCSLPPILHVLRAVSSCLRASRRQDRSHCPPTVPSKEEAELKIVHPVICTHLITTDQKKAFILHRKTGLTVFHPAHGNKNLVAWGFEPPSCSNLCNWNVEKMELSNGRLMGEKGEAVSALLLRLGFNYFSPTVYLFLFPTPAAWSYLCTPWKDVDIILS